MYIEKKFKKYNFSLDNLYYVMYSNMHKEVYMDIQLKKGLLDLMVLASIKYEDSYGYKIIQDISPIIDISESTLYPILKRLEKQKLVNTYKSTYNSRIRKYYQINALGLDKLNESINDFDEIKKIYAFIKR